MAVSAALAGAGLGLALRQVRRTLPARHVPMLGLSAAFLFVAQMLNFPVLAGTSGHLIGGVLVAALLGPSAAVVVVTTVLIVQSFLFQDGGVLALGANLFNMAILGAGGGWVVYRGLQAVLPGARGRLAALAFAGWFSTVLAAIGCAGQLAWSGKVEWEAAFTAMAGVHLFIGLGEGLITALVFAAIQRTRPELIPNAQTADAVQRGGEFLRYGLMVTAGLARRAQALRSERQSTGSPTAVRRFCWRNTAPLSPSAGRHGGTCRSKASLLWSSRTAGRRPTIRAKRPIIASRMNLWHRPQGQMMRKVIAYSFLLIAGLVLSQLLPGLLGNAYAPWPDVIKLLTMVALAFIMVHVGYEFDIDKSRLREYGWDYVVAATAAAFPWIFCAAYMAVVLAPEGAWRTWATWRDSLLVGRFAAPTSAGVLFSMLIAAGLGTTWVFRKTRILAIFDDLDTVLLMIPLKMMIVGLRWQLGFVLAAMAALLWLAWRYLHHWHIPVGWPWVIGYSAAIALLGEAVYLASRMIDEVVPIHLEVLLPAFVLGCLIARPTGHAHGNGHIDVLDTPREKRAATIISACFMVLVGLSMPPMIGLTGQAAEVAAADRSVSQTHVHDSTETAGQATQPPGPAMIAVHVLLVTLLANLGKMYPAFCYRREADWRQRTAVAVAMWPRGEVGAGVLIVSLSYGIGGTWLTVAMLSLALNLLLTGAFIVIVGRLIVGSEAAIQDRVQRGPGC